jgi:hypothetical protein
MSIFQRVNLNMWVKIQQMNKNFRDFIVIYFPDIEKNMNSQASIHPEILHRKFSQKLEEVIFLYRSQ